MKQILCVTDLSESSEKVLEVAAGMANACHAHLVVLFPYRLINYGYDQDMATLKTKLETDARLKFLSIKKNLSIMDIVSSEFQPEIGFLSDRINAHVKNAKADMIIIGQRQSVTTNDIKGFDLQNLISHSKLPFMIVPEETGAESVVI